MKKSYLLLFLLTFLYTISYGQGSPTCAGADPFCAGGSTLTFPNVSSGPSAEPGIDYACVLTQPNPAWFYMQVSVSGPLTFQISQTNTSGGGIDVDFIAWGPFNAPSCSGANLNPSTQVGCSYSTAAIENFSIPNAIAGQYYMLLITNFSNQPGSISLTQTNGTVPGHGETNCDIVCPLSITGAAPPCPTTILTAVYLNASAPTFQWSDASGPIPGATGSTYTTSVPGTYTVVANSPGCYANASVTVTVPPPTAAPVTQPPVTLTECGPLPTFFDLTQNDETFMGLNSSDYSILGYFHSAADAQSGISPIGTPANYSGTDNEVIYIGIEDVNGGCISVVSFSLDVSDCGPISPGPQQVCDDASNNGTEIFDLDALIPTILGTHNPANYNVTFHLSQSDADADTGAISPSNAYVGGPNQTIFIRMEEISDPTLYGTNTFTLVVHPRPATPNPSDVTVCDSYTLPALPPGQTYHTLPNGGGVTPPATITTTQTIYIFAQSGTSPNCTAEGDFLVTVNNTPATPVVSNVTACDSYALPALAAGQTYHADAAGVPGAVIALPYTVNSTQTIWVVAATGTTPDCKSQASFTVTINNTPATPVVSNVTACDSYALPALAAGQTYHADAAGVPGAVIALPYTVSTTQTIWVVAETATTPNCVAQASFTVTINNTPAVPVVSNVSACDSYALPALAAGQTYHADAAGAPGAVIGLPYTVTSTQTIWIVAETGTSPNCVSQASFTVTINTTPPTPVVSNITACDGYALPALSAGQSYHADAAGAPGALIALPYTVSSTQTIWVVAQTGTIPNCSSQASFTVTINNTPATPVVSNVTACDGYALPALSTGQTYHADAAGAPGAVIALPYTVSSTQTIWIVAETGTSPNCVSQASFTVTINATPPTPVVSNVTACDGYALPALSAGQTYHADAAGAPGAVISLPYTVNSTRTIWVVAQTGTTPNCSSQASFTVTINITPIADDPSDVTACDSYTLPNLNTGGYFSGPNGTGTPYSAGDVITTSMTMYVYAQSGTTPNCFTQNDFNIGIFYSPVISTPSDYHVCDDNNDGFSCLFVLSTKNAQVTSNPALTVSYHETLTDAQNGANALSLSGYCNIVSGHQTLYVRVFDPLAPLCYSITTLELYVDPVPVPNPSIDDYRLCDVNNPGDLVEGFNLPLWDAEILNGQTGIVVTYYQSQGDALAGTGAINTAVPYNNTGSPQQIWIRLTNPVSGCFAVSSFNLYVDPLPFVSAPVTLNECGSASGIAQFDLTAESLDISGGIPGTSVTYHLTQAEALSGSNPLPSPYANATNPQVIYASVHEDAHGCVNTTAVTLTVSTGPSIGTPTMLQECDDNNDGYAQFDLNQSLVQVVGSNPPPAGITVTFHETLTDAQNGQTPVGANYFNINPSDQIIYVRASYDATGCYSIVPLALHVNPTPQIAENIGPKHVCDEDTDGIGTFNLTLYTAELLGGLNPLQHTLTYHLSQADAQGDTGAITNVLGFHNTIPGTQTVWVRLEDNLTGCFDVMALVLVVDPKPALPPTPTGAVTPYTLCDVNNPGDEKEQFDLSTKVAEILNGQTGVTVGFYPTLADAQAQTNELPNLYTNITNAQTIHVVMENTAGCFALTTMDLRVEPLPILIPPAGGPVRVCDPDGDGFALFDLQGLVANMLQGAPDITVSFHETLADAQSGANPIVLNPYPNITPFVQIIYARAVNSQSGCENTLAIELNAIASPVVPVLQDMARCDEDANNQDGRALFDLTQQEADILAAQSGPASDYTITYHLTQAEAQNGTGPIFPATAYTNQINPQTIWVRVSENGGGACFNIGSFDLRVYLPLALTTPTQLTICDDGPTSAIPQAVFDLTVKNNEITGAAAGYTVSYYQTQADALAGINAIPNPQAYTNNPNPQTLFVAVSGPSPQACRSYTTLTIRVLPLPVPQTQDIPAIEACDDTAPVGSEPFDLTQNEDYIRDNDTGLIFEYYQSQSDAETRTDPIPVPTAYDSGSGIVWIRIMKGTEADYLGEYCYVVVPQELILHPLPVVEPAPLDECDPAASNTAVFTLSEANDNVIHADPSQNVADFTFEYYLTLADAQAGVNQLPDQYTNLTNPQDITVVVVNNLTGCRNYATVTLSVKAGAVAATGVDAPAVCDDGGLDGMTDIILTDLDTQILGAQDPSQFTVAYFATQADAALGSAPLASPAYLGTGDIWAVVTNTATGCRSDAVQVGITVRPLADVVISSNTGGNTLCVEWGTNTIVQDLILSSNLATTPGYTFQWYLNGTAIPGATAASYPVPVGGAGDYTLEATSAQGCVSPSAVAFAAVQSGQAVLVSVSVSDAFQDSQSITVVVEGHGSGFYQFQLDDGPILDNGGVFTNVSPGTHTIRVYDMKGNGVANCGFLEIPDIHTIDYPHFFTPNGDGINDTWKIEGLDDTAKIYIFDRYGKLVKQIAPNGDGWDGTYNGQPLPSTDYWFTVYYNEPNATVTVNKEFKAHFSLKR